MHLSFETRPDAWNSVIRLGAAYRIYSYILGADLCTQYDDHIAYGQAMHDESGMSLTLTPPSVSILFGQPRKP